MTEIIPQPDNIKGKEVSAVRVGDNMAPKEIKELREARLALLNMLEDTEEARKKAEEEKNKTLSIITNFTDGLLVFDQNNVLILINPKTEEIFGLRDQKVIGQKISGLGRVEALKPLVDLLGKKLQGIFRKEIEVKDKKTLEVTTVSVGKDENNLGTIVILHDVSREKIVEEMKTEFVSLAAHQLRTPLSAIKWTLKMLLDNDLGKISKEQREFIGKTYQSNERMIGLINDLLDVTRIEEGRYLYKPGPADLESVVQFVANSRKEEAQRRKISVEFKKPSVKLPKVILDVEKMRLVIQNLLDNAIKYTSSGGKVTLSLKYVKEKKEVEFRIKDTGVGIPKEQQNRVFTKFFRGANVVRMETDGSGLGLFIAKNIVEAHGGRIWFDPEEEKGTAFYFTVPVKREFSEFLKNF